MRRGIKYHIIQCHNEGVSDEELEETLSIGLIVGGSIVIPYLREAFTTWDGLKEAENSKGTKKWKAGKNYSIHSEKEQEKL